MAIEGKYKIPGLTGLVVCGGKSSRMGMDKCMLDYHGLPECFRMAGLLGLFCSDVQLSCNESQVTAMGHRYPVLVDLPRYRDTGPLAGLLTAIEHDAEHDLLVTGCDYPYFNSTELTRFVRFFKESTGPSAFYNYQAGKYEPLLAFYPSSCFHSLKEMHASRHFSLQYFLETNNAAKFLPQDTNVIRSIDTLIDHERTLNSFKHTTIKS